MRTLSPSENLRLCLQELHQLRHRCRSFAHYAAGLSFRGELEFAYYDLWFYELSRFGLERLLLRGHDSLQGRIARGVETLVDGKHRGQPKLHDLLRAFELSLGGSLSVGDIQRRDRRHASKAQELSRHRADNSIRGIGRHLSEENQIVCARFQLLGECLCYGKSVKGHLVGLELDTAVGSHAQSFPNRFLYNVGAKRNDRNLAASILFLQLERGLDGPRGEVIYVEFEPSLIERGVVSADLEADIHVRNPLDAHGNLHREISM